MAPSLPQFTYVLQNPSRAGANTDDGTSRKLYWIIKANGGGGFELVNLFATVDTGQVGLHLSEAVGHALGENDSGSLERLSALRSWLLGGALAMGSRQRPSRGRRRSVDVQCRSGRTSGIESCGAWAQMGAPGHPDTLDRGSRTTQSWFGISQQVATLCDEWNPGAGKRCT